MAEDFMTAAVKRVEAQFAKKAAFPKAVQHLKEKKTRSRCVTA